MREYHQETVRSPEPVKPGTPQPASTGGAVNGLLQLQRQYGNRYVQRMLIRARKETGDAVIDPAVELAIARARGGGQGLDSGVRRQMEQAFGSDFGGVRVHTGPEAHALNKTLNAVAFTTGQDIFFRDSAYNPGSRPGKELLAHELTHVVQQGGPAVQGKLTLGPAGDRYEQEADLVAKIVTADIEATSTPTPTAAPAGPVQRQCACGSHSDSGGECAECRSKREARAAAKTALRVQRKQQAAPIAASPAGTGLVQRDPFDTTGPDNAHCKDKVTEDGAVCADHVNTACSVGGAATAGAGLLIGAGIGSMIAPGVGTLIGGAVGGLVAGIGGALAYGKCVEKMNAACRARTNQALKKCDQQFPAPVGVLDQDQGQQQMAQQDQGTAADTESGTAA
jgi:hypothetical protein